VKSQAAGASQKELEEIKLQMEKSKNNLIFENFKQRNVVIYLFSFVINIKLPADTLLFIYI